MIFFTLSFWAAIFAVLYTIIIYPLVLAVASMFFSRKFKRGDHIRNVDLIIPVHNGEKEIEKKIQNCLSFDYPKNAVNIIVVSDGSDDKTVDIVEKYRSKGIRCISLAERHGKVAAQNKALEDSQSDIVVFTDVSILLNPSALKEIISNFTDESIGAVSCQDQIEKANKERIGDAAYINYDMFVRRFTNNVGSLIGVTGGFYAVRREIAGGGWNPEFPPDFYVALKAIKMGYRVIQDDRVKARYITPVSFSAEMDRKVRTITRGMWALVFNLKMLNPFIYGMVSFQLVSHKMMRWMLPFFLLTCFISNVYLFFQTDSLFYSLAFWLQILSYFAALVSFIGVYYGQFKNPFCRISATLLMFNISLVLSWKNLFLGKKIVKWEPTKRI